MNDLRMKFFTPENTKIVVKRTEKGRLYMQEICRKTYLKSEKVRISEKELNELRNDFKTN